MSSDRIRLFSTDLDGTLLGDPAAAVRFAGLWSGTDPAHRPLLVYNTGRTVDNTRALVTARELPEPDYIIGSVGTEVDAAPAKGGDEFWQELESGWNLAEVQRIVGQIPGIQPQPEVFANRYKSSWFLTRARREQLSALEKQLRDAGLRAQIVYSCRYFLDVVPTAAGKGAALVWLCRQLSIPLDEVLVAGDTANDTGMFLLPGVKGILVQNALPEIVAELAGQRVFHASSGMADGVIEGLRHYGVLSNPASNPAPAMADVPLCERC
jgi:sucrose-6-phosphatase